MNLRCIYCQTPFTLSRAEMLNGIIVMNEKHQNHYDAHCPRCRRANSISRQRMELFFPNWQAAARELASAPAPVETPAPAHKLETPATALLKTEPLPKATKEMMEKKLAEKQAEKAAALSAKEKKPAAAKAPAAKSSAKAKKPSATSKKPAAATTSKEKKPTKKTAEPKAKKK
jgi:hypothetical protein